MKRRVDNSYLGEWGELVVAAFAEQIVGEEVRRVGVGRGGRESVDMVSARYAVEVKTVLEGTEPKVRPARRAFAEKKAYALVTGKEPLTVLVVLSPAAWVVKVFKRSGFGAYRANAMHYVGQFQVRQVLAPGEKATNVKA